MQSGIPTIIPQQILQLKQIFGINTSVPKSISILPAERIFYLAGYYGVIFNPKEKEKSQSYFSGADGNCQITSVAMSSNKKTMAMGFKSLEKPCIIYYELNTSAKKKRIEYTDAFSFHSWVALAFSTGNDTKHLASLTNKNSNGQAILAFWNPDRTKCEAQIKLTGREEKDFTEILFNPNLETLVLTLLGEKTFRSFELKEMIEQKSFSLEEVTQEGARELTQKYTLRSHHYLSASPHILIMAEQVSLVVDYQGVIVQKIQVVGTCCANWSDGLLLANSQLTFLRFEEQKYIIKNSYDGLDKDSEVRAICTNDDKVLALLSSGAMLSGKLRYEANKDTVKVQMQPNNLHFHSGPIVGMDVCVRKPLIATASKDKTIKIWNYEDRTVQTPKIQAETASCLSFHPSGLHLAVAYPDKLRILNIQKDGEAMSNFKDINSLRNCTYVKFSNGGQYLAATSGNVVLVYKFYTGQNPPGMTFSGHTGKIKCVAWSKEDNILVTCGTDGVIMAFRVRMQNCGQRILYSPSSKETRIKGVSYSSVMMSMDNSIYALGLVSSTGDRIFKQLRLDGNENPRELAHNNCSQMVFSSTGRIMFCGCDDRDRAAGSIKCYKFPSTAHMEEFQAHDSGGVEKVCVTADDRYLVSAGRDGCVMMFQIRDKEARPDRLKEVLPVSNEILITKNDLDTLKAEIDNLRQEEAELASNSSSGPIKDDHIKQLKEKNASDQAQFNQKYNSIVEKKNLMKKKFDEEIRAKKEEFESGLQQYDSNQAKNVMQESAKYDQLKRSQEQESRLFQKEIQRHQSDNEKDLRRLQEDYHESINNEKDRKVDVRRKIERLEREHQETMKQIMEEKMEEINKIRNENSMQVQNITEASLRAKSDVSITKKKISEKEQEKESNIQQQRENKDEIERLEKANKQLQKDIETQESVIQERDKTIDANERKIYELKKKSQELQKFKYVLDHKIKELKKDIAPREQQIAKMKAQTNKMDKDLKKLNSLNTGLAEFVAILFNKQASLKEKIAAQRARISYQQNKIKLFKDALFQASQQIQDEQQLQKSVQNLKVSFVSQSMTQAKMDSEIEHQYRNQKKYLEKSISMLKKNLQKDSDIHKHENVRIMKENVDLIKEIGRLRLEIKEDNMKKGKDQEKKNKNEPTEDAIRAEINERNIAIAELQEKISALQRENSLQD